MKTIAVIAQKGGVAKTTLCINLAIQAHLERKFSAIIDIDPQGSIADWAHIRKKDWPLMRDSSLTNLNKMHGLLQKHNVDFCFIDTAPKDDHASAQTAAKITDLFLIPVGASVVDIRGIAPTVEIVRKTRKPAIFVLSRFSKKNIRDDASRIKDLLKKKYPDIKIAPTILETRDTYTSALELGLGAMEYTPKRGAAQDIKKIYRFTINQIKEK